MHVAAGVSHRGEKRLALIEVAVDLVRNDFGIGIRGKTETLLFLRSAQCLVVLDNAVVDHRDPVAADVRVGVVLTGLAVGRPAGVRNAARSVHRMQIEGPGQLGDLSGGAQTLELRGPVEHRQPGGIIAAVFQSPQTFNQDGSDFTLGNSTDYSAHSGDSVVDFMQLSGAARGH